MNIWNWFHFIARSAAVVGLAAVAVGCAGLPPGAGVPRGVSVALAQPEQTHLGGQIAASSGAHDGSSGFRIITLGVDGLLTRVQMLDDAERTADLQYFIFRGDVAGRLMIDALSRAATRGVRVRCLLYTSDAADE